MKLFKTKLFLSHNQKI